MNYVHRKLIMSVCQVMLATDGRGAFHPFGSQNFSDSSPAQNVATLRPHPERQRIRPSWASMTSVFNSGFQ